jgi:hypothetical protein
MSTPPRAPTLHWILTQELPGWRWPFQVRFAPHVSSLPAIVSAARGRTGHPGGARPGDTGLSRHGQMDGGTRTRSMGARSVERGDRAYHSARRDDAGDPQ